MRMRHAEKLSEERCWAVTIFITVDQSASFSLALCASFPGVGLKTNSVVVSFVGLCLNEATEFVR